MYRAKRVIIRLPVQMDGEKLRMAETSSQIKSSKV